MASRTSLATGTRLALYLAAAFIPTLTLIPLGGLYLFEKGYLLWWALGALAVVAIMVSLIWRVLLSPPAHRAAGNSSSAARDERLDVSGAAPDPHWSPLEEEAWTDVRALARSVDLEKLESTEAFLELGRQTVETVAGRLHPGRSQASLQFTLPEALAISEHVSKRLAHFVATHIPLSDTLTIAQIWSVYRWRSAIGIAERAYDVWRVLRLANPATALTHEARERLSRAVLKWGREHVTRRLAEAFVEEVGRAAIDLYGGRLRIEMPADGAASPDIAAASGMASISDHPLRLAIAGGRLDNRAAVSALLTTPREQSTTSPVEPLPRLALTLSVDETRDATTAAKVARSLLGADLVVWLVEADIGADAFDEAALAAVGRHFGDNLSLRAPPVLVIAIGSSPKSHNKAAASELQHLGASRGGVSPVTAVISLQTVQQQDAAKLIEEQLTRLVPDARRAQIGRQIASSKSRSGAVKAGRRAISATATMLRTLLRPTR